LVTVAIRNVVFRETLRYTLQAVAIAPMLYFVVHAPESLVGRILNTRILGRLGILSYSLYLLHATVLLEMNRLLHSKVLAAIVAFMVAVMLAEATHILVEEPTERLRKRFAHTGAPRQQHSIEPRATLTAQLEGN
jgi:peptidoglycan/LPS O-acetylase OafA/YrhL